MILDQTYEFSVFIEDGSFADRFLWIFFSSEMLVPIIYAQFQLRPPKMSVIYSLNRLFFSNMICCKVRGLLFIIAICLLVKIPMNHYHDIMILDFCMMIFYILHLDREISNLSCVCWVCFVLHFLLTFPHAKPLNQIKQRLTTQDISLQ